MAYDYAVYSVQDQVRTNATNVAIQAKVDDGWRAHTVNCNFAELCIFWEKWPTAGDMDALEDTPPEDPASEIAQQRADKTPPVLKGSKL